jgi:hypothetical protein
MLLTATTASTCLTRLPRRRVQLGRETGSRAARSIFGERAEGQWELVSLSERLTVIIANPSGLLAAVDEAHESFAEHIQAGGAKNGRAKPYPQVPALPTRPPER